MLRAKSPRYGTPVLQVYSSGVLCTLQRASDVVPRDAEHVCGQDRTPPTWRPPGIGIRIRIRAPRHSYVGKGARPRILHVDATDQGKHPHTWQTSRAGAGAHQGGGCSGNSWLSSFVRRRARAGRGAPARRFSPVATRGRIRLRARVSRREPRRERERERPTATATPPAVEAAGVCRVAFLPILVVVVVVSLSVLAADKSIDCAP